MAAVNPFAVADVMDELKKVFESTEYRAKMCRAILKRQGFVRDYIGWADPTGNGSHSNVRTAFGEYDRDRYIPNPRYTEWYFPSKCGIEVLGQCPLAMKVTFSVKCNITIPELKEACAKNGIRVWTAWRKVQILQALMKV